MTFLGLSLGLTGARPLLAIEEAGERLTLTALSAGAEVRGQAQVARTGDLARDLGSGLAALRAASQRPPRDAILLTDRATTACLELPALAQLPDDEVAGLVRFELEPLLPAPAVAGLACGWATGQAGGAGGALLACGLPTDEREALAQAFRRAGLRLSGIYGRGSCAAALVPALDDATVVELVPGGVGASRLRGGRVTQLQQTQTRDALETRRAALELASPEGPLVLLGPADADLVAQLQALHTDVRHQLAEPGVAPSVLGAARHALGLPGGERMAGVRGRAARPLRSRRWLQVALALSALAACVAGLDLLTQTRLRTAVAAHAQADGAVRGQRLRAQAVEQRARERRVLQGEVAALEAEQAHARSGAQRGAELVALVDALAGTAPAGLVLERLDDRGDALTLVGRCGSPSAVQGFLDDLARALGPRGLAVALRRVTRDPESASYLFEARLERGGA